jgi:dienelactone hydrolase
MATLWTFTLSQAQQNGGPASARLPGTEPLTAAGDLALEMVDAIGAYLERETEATRAHREQHYQRDFTSPAAYHHSLEPNRKRLRRIIGAVDTVLPASNLLFQSASTPPAAIAAGPNYDVYSVRLPVFPGVEVTGLLLQPRRAPVARVVALPDADETPEELAGLSQPGGFAKRLAESGCQVLVIDLVDRKDTWSGVPHIRMTNQPHREWIYRMAFETGRHIIGYEVQKVLAAINGFTRENERPGSGAVPIGITGYGEGGLVALYSAALDNRAQAVWVSGYFQPREQLWKEPVYRDVWGLLREFGDAELAGMVAPRGLVVEASGMPAVTGPPTETKQRRGAAPVGSLRTPELADVRREAERARTWFAKLGAAERLQVIDAGENGTGAPGSEQSLNAWFALLANAKLSPARQAPKPLQAGTVDAEARRRLAFDQLVEHTQRLVRESPRRRAEFWKSADDSSPERWKESTRFHRNYIWDEVIGRMPEPNTPAHPRSRLIYDEPSFRGYEVVLDVWPGIYAQGILLVPRSIKPGERRPVVVCQHGLEGRPSDVADPRSTNPAYHRYAVRLAEEGFITFSPQNPYIGQDRFRILQKKGHPVKLALFSFILGQHQRILEWLSSLPFADPARIGFYGLSYGGKTAVRVPPLLEGYVLSICSADFNEWVWKVTSIEAPYTYMLTQEYDMLEFDFANVVNYGELANLMAPRPFMVERGHGDGVAPDEWVAYEFAKVRRFYNTRMKLPGHAEIEFFDGPHTIHGQGTFAFLRRHLQWPR